MTTSGGRVALVTGGTRGIGLGIAEALAADGWRLALCGMRPHTDVRGILESLRARAARVEYLQADVAQRADRERLLSSALSLFDRIHALVNNAGRAPRVRADLLDASEESFEELVRTNLQGPYFLSQAVARTMIDERRRDLSFDGAIVFVTSVSAEFASLNRGDYCVSKAGLSMTAKLFASRLAPEGIAVYEVRPGIIATDMTAAAKDTYDVQIAAGLVPERRWGQPADVGRVVATLLSGNVPYATGSIVMVDGGLSIRRL